jgi:hypothetical protein
MQKSIYKCPMFKSYVKLPDGIWILIWKWDVPGPSVTNHSTQAMTNGEMAISCQQKRIMRTTTMKMK